MSRREFPESVKRDAAARSEGRCEAVWEGVRCDMKLRSGEFHYDHFIADNLGGEPTLGNCVVTCLPCHKKKTREHDMPRIVKGRRIRDRERGIKSKSRSWGYGRDDRFKMKMNRTLVDRLTGQPVSRSK